MIACVRCGILTQKPKQGRRKYCKRCAEEREIEFTAKGVEMREQQPADKIPDEWK